MVINMAQLIGLDIENIGMHIYKIMKSKQISIMDVSQYLGVSYQAVYKWTRGKSLPDIENFYNLSRYLGVTIDEILSKKCLVKNQIFSQKSKHLWAYYECFRNLQVTFQAHTNHYADLCGENDCTDRGACPSP